MADVTDFWDRRGQKSPSNADKKLHKRSVIVKGYGRIFSNKVEAKARKEPKFKTALKKSQPEMWEFLFGDDD